MLACCTNNIEEVPQYSTSEPELSDTNPLVLYEYVRF